MIRIGVIGCGQRMRSLARELVGFGDISLKMVYDPQPGQVERFVQELGQSMRPRQADSWKQLVENKSLDWVLIGSPNAHHAKQAAASLTAGKQVFLEKPLAVTMDECLELMRVQEETGSKLVTGFVLRWSPLYQRMHRLLSELDFGPVVSFQACEHISYEHGAYMMRGWRRDRSIAGSYALEKCVHDLDLIQWMTGSPVCAVTALGGRKIYIGKNREALPILKDIQWEEKGNLDLPHPCFDEPDLVEDHFSALIRCSSGISGVLQASAGSAVPLRRLSLHCLTGWIEAELYSGTLRYRTCSMEHEKLLSWSFNDLHGGGDAPLAAGLHLSMLSRENERQQMIEGVQATMAGIALGESMDRREWIDISAQLGLIDYR